MLIILITVAFLVFTIVFFGFLTSRDRSVLFSRGQKFEYNGQVRTFRTYVPNNIGNNPKMIFAFHGLGGNGRQIAYFSALHNTTGDNTIMVYPDATKSPKPGVKAGFNAGFCCGSGWVDQVDDVGFTKALVADLSKKYNVSKDHTFATGFSNGGMFTQRLATDEPDLFAGYASVSGNIGTVGNEATPKQPVPMMLIHGDKDKIVPFNGGPGGSDAKLIWNSFSTTTTAWGKANKCSDSKTQDSEATEITTYGECSAPLKIIVYKNKGHLWPDWRLADFWHKKTAGSKAVVDFFNSL